MGRKRNIIKALRAGAQKLPRRPPRGFHVRSAEGYLAKIEGLPTPRVERLHPSITADWKTICVTCKRRVRIGEVRPPRATMCIYCVED